MRRTSNPEPRGEGQHSTAFYCSTTGPIRLASSNFVSGGKPGTMNDVTLLRAINGLKSPPFNCSRLCAVLESANAVNPQNWRLRAKLDLTGPDSRATAVEQFTFD